jgi:hypothetical protein
LTSAVKARDDALSESGARAIVIRPVSAATLAWVLAGTALTFLVNEAFFRLLMDQSVLSMNTRWSSG